jgi:hypothetical protein
MKIEGEVEFLGRRRRSMGMDELAAAQGHPTTAAAQINLRVVRRSGSGAAKDAVVAAHWFKWPPIKAMGARRTGIVPA